MLYTQQQLRDRIKQLDTEIAEGITSVATDGTQTTVSLAEKRAERDRLQRQLTAARNRRPTTATMHLGGF